MPNSSSKAMTSSTVSKLSAGQGRLGDDRGWIDAKMAADNHHNLLGKVSQPPGLLG
jgi:hypothetical protein